MYNIKKRAQTFCKGEIKGFDVQIQWRWREVSKSYLLLGLKRILSGFAAKNFSGDAISRSDVTTRFTRLDL